MQAQLDISVVISTYNRCGRLAEAVESVLAQEAEGVRYEVIVVDNNSTDRTRQVVESRGKGVPHLRYVFEERQGVSYGRNAGITSSRSRTIAFTDDDVRVAPDWIATIQKTLEEHPEIGFIGGKVLPVWTTTPPRWLTREHWMPLGLQDHGDADFYLEPSRVTGVISASLVVRRASLELIGGFSSDLQLKRDGIGSMEDHDLVARLWKAGITGLYVPQLVVRTEVPAERMRKKYHRKWHEGHGRNYAIMREERMERASWYLFGVPAHLYRQAFRDTMGLIKHRLLRQEDPAFLCEGRLWFFFAFWLKRMQDSKSKNAKARLRG